VSQWQFSLFSVFALAAGLFALAAGTLLLAFLPVGRWRQHRFFALVTLSAGLFAAADLGSNAPVPFWLKQDLALLQLFCSALHVSAWVAYLARDLGPLYTRGQRALELSPLVLGALLVAFPRLALTGEVFVYPRAIWGTTYRISLVTPWCQATLVFLTGLLALVFQRYLAAALGGRPLAWAHAAALGVFLGFAVVDVGTMNHLWTLPLLTPYGAALGSLPIVFVLAQRWRQDVAQHDAMAQSLERQVVQRTKDLSAALAALGRSEKLATVGRLAGGLAHQINNPGAALIANLEYLELALSRGDLLPGDAREAVGDSLHSARRISGAVRQLLLLSRTAIAESEGHSFDLKLVAGQALRTARANKAGRRAAAAHALPQIAYDDVIPEGLRSSGRGQLLEQALQALLEQLSHSAPEHLGPRITLDARREGSRIRLEVRTNFRGLGSAVRAQLGEAFLGATSSEGDSDPADTNEGASIGLAASLGLLRTLGVEVHLEEHGHGSTIALLLERAEPAPLREAS
jgi:signal transduction histidine kinase